MFMMLPFFLLHFLFSLLKLHKQLTTNSKEMECLNKIETN